MDGLLTRTLEILWADDNGQPWIENVDSLPYDRLPDLATADHEDLVAWLGTLSDEGVYGEALAYRRWDAHKGAFGSWVMVGEDADDGFDPWVEAVAS